MEFTTNAKEMLDTLKRASRIIPKNPYLNILENVRIYSQNGDIRMTGTDLKTFCDFKVPVKERTGDGEALMSASALKRTLSEMSKSDVRIQIEDGQENGAWHIIQDGLKINGESLDPVIDFPAMPEIESEWKTFDRPDFLEKIHAALNFVGTEEWRKMLMGVYCHKPGICATNGGILYFEPMPVPFDCIIPSETANVLPQTVSPIQWRKNKERHEFMVDEDRYVFSPVDATYPPYSTSIPKESAPWSMTVDRKALINAVKRLIPHASVLHNQLVLNASSGGIQLQVYDPMDDKLVAEISVAVNGWHSITGENLRIGLNGQYLITILRSLDAEVVSLDFYGPARPVIMKNMDTKSQGLRLIMPIKLSE